MQHALELSLDTFKTSLFYSMLFKETGQICLGFGWATQPIELSVNFYFEFVDCYKTIIDDLCDWGPSWDGRDARIIDECNPSGTSQDATLQDYLLSDTISDTPFLGGRDEDEYGCWQFAEWTKWTPYIAKAGMQYLNDFLGEPMHHPMSLAEYDAKR